MTVDISEQKFNQLLSDVSDIKSELMGSTKYNRKGIVHRVSDNETDVQDLKDFKKKMTAYIVGLSAGSGAAAATAIKILFG